MPPSPVPAAQTRYARVAQALIADIAGGRYRVGARMPTEAELEARFGVSRHTVRAAIRYLRDRGLVTARAGIGTTVLAKSVPDKAVLSMNSVAELLRFTRDTRLQLVGEDTVPADAALAAMLGCKPGEAWPRFEFVRIVPRMREGIGAISTWVRPEFAAIADEVRDSPHTVISLLERRFGVEFGELQQDISPALMPADLARRLKVRPRTPALRILRHYCDRNGGILQVSLGHYPGGRFSYNTRMRVASR
ncbi:MAG: GntR family transcriptional regulator [Betaproteobacteria bacterium]|nr:GntR family transcriptional regulator [Betaproteobacteria bacterium]